VSTLLIGYGNVTRSDDGVGVYVAQEIEKEAIPDLEIRTSHQLHVELVEDLLDYEKVILADASSEGPDVAISKIQPSSTPPMASSHHLGPELLASLMLITHHALPDLYVCTVRGECFDFGEKISDKTLRRAQTAIEKIKSLLGKKDASHA